MKRRGSITAGELMAQIAGSPEYQARSAEAEKKHRELVAHRRKVREVVNTELRQAGIEKDFAAMSDEGATPQAAYPILLRHLKHKTMPNHELGVLARCFASPSAQAYWPDILHEYVLKRGDDSNSDQFMQGLAHALGDMWTTDAQVAELYSLLGDEGFKTARIPLMERVRKAKIPGFRELFEKLAATDPYLSKEIRSWRAYWKRVNPAILQLGK